MKRKKIFWGNVAACMAAAILMSGCGSAKAPADNVEETENVANEAEAEQPDEAQETEEVIEAGDTAEAQDEVPTQESGEIIASDNLFTGLYEVSFESDENAPFEDKLKELEALNAESTTEFPEDITMDDFVAHVSYCGDDSDNEQCIIYKDNASLLTAKVKNAGGEQEKFSGKVTGEDSFFNEVKKLKSEEALNEESASYGVLYFNKDGKVYSCYTKNFFRY